MNLYKFIDKDTVIRAKNPLHVENTYIANPKEETLKKLGYANLIEASAMPEVNENEMLVPQYALNEDGVIIQSYKVEAIENESV